MTVWQVASIPFWTLSSGMTFIALFAAAYAIFGRKDVELPPIMFGAFILILGAGVLAIIAAKIAS